jgi:hypothetical protein
MISARVTVEKFGEPEVVAIQETVRQVLALTGAEQTGQIAREEQPEQIAIYIDGRPARFIEGPGRRPGRGGGVPMLSARDFFSAKRTIWIYAVPSVSLAGLTAFLRDLANQAAYSGNAKRRSGRAGSDWSFVHGSSVLASVDNLTTTALRDRKLFFVASYPYAMKMNRARALPLAIAFRNSRDLTRGQTAGMKGKSMISAISRRANRADRWRGLLYFVGFKYYPGSRPGAPGYPTWGIRIWPLKRPILRP